MELELLTGMTSRLVLGSPAFAQQYVMADGLAPCTCRELLRADNAASVLVDATLVMSQLARLSQDNYAYIRGARLCESGLLCPLLVHADAGVRARCCNLIGNLCRHTAQFYAMLRDAQVLPLVVDCCADDDGTARKFACFAVGNAGFHSSMLYPELRCAIAPLVALLGDDDHKTRANAAGALGNLVRNSSELVSALISDGAVEALLNTVKDAMGVALTSTQPRTAMATSMASIENVDSSNNNNNTLKQHVHKQVSAAQSPMKIALFSVGNMCAHESCRNVLMRCGVMDIVRALMRHEDATVRKYAHRIEAKMGAAAAAAAAAAVPG